MSVLKTGFLLALLTVLLVFIGQWIGGSQGAVIAFGFALLVNLGAYWFSDRIVLKMHHAQPLQEAEAPQVYRAVREIASRDQLPVPKLYWIATRTPNAFATGRNPQHAAVAVTSGLLELVNEEELKGVLAHELSHVKNRDTLVMTVAAALAGAIMMLARMAQWALWFGGGGRNRESSRGTAIIQIVAIVLIALLAPLAALLIQAAISRTREFGADETGARLAGTPHGLAGALEKMERVNRAHPLPHANPAAAHLFIINPLSGEAMARLFSTHPSTAERVSRLRSMRL